MPTDHEPHVTWNGIPVLPDASLEDLKTLLTAPPPDCWVAFRALAVRADFESLDLLIHEAAGTDPLRRRAAVEAIGDRPASDRGSAAVRRLLTDHAPVVVRAAVAATARLHDQKGRDRVLALFEDPDPETRVVALRAIGELWQADDAAAVLAVATSDRAKKVRRQASLVLSDHRDEKHWRELAALWHESDLPRERTWACGLLGAYGTVDELGLATRLASDPDGHVRNAARRAVEAITRRSGP